MLDYYRKIEELSWEREFDDPLSEDAVASQDSWLIARLGQWNLKCEPKYLQSAVEGAEAVLAVGRPTPERREGHHHGPRIPQSLRWR